MIRRGRALWRHYVLAAVTLGLAGCAGVPMDPSVKPEIVSVGPYAYPYAGLTVEIDPKGYSEFAYAINGPEQDPTVGVKAAEWEPVQRKFTIDFTPTAYRSWTLAMAFRHPSDKVATVRKKFEVELPPWHATARPLEFAVKARYACLWSEHLTHMVQVKTLLAYTLEITQLPRDIDRTLYAGFAATAPSVTYSQGGEKRAVKGFGGGRAKTFSDQMRFAGNYQLSRKTDAYPRCAELEDTLALGREEWGSAAIRLTDKYQFPVESAVGRVVESVRVPKEGMVETWDKDETPKKPGS